jgi:AcrR family transcriptional regulator
VSTSHGADLVHSAGYGDGKRALLAAAVDVIANDGLRGFTYRRVSEQAAVTHGLIPYYFGNRDELVTQALNFAVAESLAATRMQNPIVAVSELGAHLIDAVLDDVALQTFQYEMALQSTRQSSLREDIHSINLDYRNAIDEHLTQIGLGGDPILTNLVYVMMDGLVLELVTLGDVNLARKTLAKMHELLSAYLR